MARWEKGIDKINSVTKEANKPVENFFEIKHHKPVNDEEKQIFDEFSLITNSMAILIHVAKADNKINKEEKEQIIDHIVFQMEQRPYEFDKLTEKFGRSEKSLILTIYDKILDEYRADRLKLDKMVDDICVIYQNNPEKRYYLIRLCYYVALSDKKFNQAEKDAIEQLAIKMNVPKEELTRIEEEVNLEVAGK